MGKSAAIASASDDSVEPLLDSAYQITKNARTKLLSLMHSMETINDPEHGPVYVCNNNVKIYSKIMKAHHKRQHRISFLSFGMHYRVKVLQSHRMHSLWLLTSP